LSRTPSKSAMSLMREAASARGTETGSSDRIARAAAKRRKKFNRLEAILLSNPKPPCRPGGSVFGFDRSKRRARYGAADCLGWGGARPRKVGKIGRNWANSAGGFLLFPWSCRVGLHPS